MPIAVLGDAYLTFYNGNTALPGSVPQLLHSDVAWRYTSAEEAHAAGESWPPAPERVSFNVSCGDVTPHGGATEIWPGSQRDTVFMSTGKDAGPFKSQASLPASEVLNPIICMTCCPL